MTWATKVTHRTDPIPQRAVSVANCVLSCRKEKRKSERERERDGEKRAGERGTEEEGDSGWNRIRLRQRLALFISVLIRPSRGGKQKVVPRRCWDCLRSRSPRSQPGGRKREKVSISRYEHKKTVPCVNCVNIESAESVCTRLSTKRSLRHLIKHYSHAPPETL